MLLAAASDPGAIWDIISRGGVPALLFVIIFGGFKTNPWWVFGWVYRDLEKRHDLLRNEKNQWRDTALSTTNLANSLDKIRKESYHE